MGVVGPSTRPFEVRRQRAAQIGTSKAYGTQSQ